MPSSRIQNSVSPLRNAEFDGSRATEFFEAREIPKIWKVPTLLRLYRLNPAVFTIQKNAGPTRLIGDGQTRSLAIESGEFLDKRRLRQTEKIRNDGQFSIRQSDLARPATAGGATVAFVKNGHGQIKATDGGAASEPDQFRIGGAFTNCATRK